MTACSARVARWMQALVATGGLAVLFAAGGESVDPKGIFVAGGDERRTSVKFNVLLERDGRKRTVNSDYRFLDGDRMKFQFQLSRESYVYVVHRTFPGDPGDDRVRRYAGAKGIEVVRDDDRRVGGGRSGRDRYRLLFPTRGTGRENRLRAGAVHTVPFERGSYFTMDDEPGIEKLYLVASPTRLGIEELFDGLDGALRRRPGQPRGSGGGVRERDDRDEDVLAQLNRRLVEYSRNAAVSKGIHVERDDGYSAGVDGDRPFLTEVDLAHHRRRR